MNNLIAYRCLNCGQYTISKHDGIRCKNCNGPVVPAGPAIIREKGNEVSVQVKMEGYEEMKEQIKELTILTNKLKESLPYYKHETTST